MMTQIEEKREEIIRNLQNQFNLTNAACERILFLNIKELYEPWIPADILQAIARQMNGFKDSSVIYDKYVPNTNQVVFTATVHDMQDRSYTRTGVATQGESDIAAEVLAEGRALGAALSAAGFHPYKSASVVEITEPVGLPKYTGPATQNQFTKEQDESALRRNDLFRIHDIAEKKGLIVNKDKTLYREKLSEQFGVTTAAVLDAPSRARVINWLENLPADEWSGLPVDLREDAAIA